VAVPPTLIVILAAIPGLAIEWKNATFLFDPDAEHQVTCAGASD
jgi:hypothetical protein